MIIELRNVVKDYANNFRALDGVNLSVKPGEVFGYIGANGAGKTTTIKILTGLMRPTSGEAWVGGYSVQKDPVKVKAQIGYVPESGAVFEKLSPREYLTAIGHLYKMPDAAIRSRIDEWLAYFGITDKIDARMDSFSKGTKQKVCWAAALLHDPRVYVLDEPLNGLDVETVSKTKDLMRYIASTGRTVFYTSHLVDLVEKVCDRVAVINRGRILCVGTSREIRALVGAPTLEQALLTFIQAPPPSDATSPFAPYGLQ